MGIINRLSSKKLTLVCGLLSSAFSLSAHSLPINFFQLPTVYTVSGQMGFSNSGKSQVITFLPGIVKAYTNKKVYRQVLTGGLFIGKETSLMPHASLQLGFSFSAKTDKRINGRVWDDADPNFENLQYHYDVKQKSISIGGRLIFNNKVVAPWLMASVGAGFNRAYAYNNSPLIPAAIPDSNFRDSTRVSLTYALGAGLQKAISANVQLGLGYVFNDWGSAGLARAPQGQFVGSGLKVNHIKTHNGVLYFTYRTL